MYISITRITIILCWLSLFAFWGLKLFGGNLFEIVVENENFVALSNYIENSWLRYLSSFITIFVARYLTLGAVCQKFLFKGKSLFAVIFAIISIWFVVNFIDNEIVKMVYGYAVIIATGLIFQKRYGKLYGLLSVALDFAFSTLSMVIRSVELSLVYDYLISHILSIDMYIMYTLYYLYFNSIRLKKEI